MIISRITMKITQKSYKSKRTILITSLVVLLLGASFVAYAYATKLPGTPFEANTTNQESTESTGDTSNTDVENNNPVPDTGVTTDNTNKENLGNETPPNTAGPNIIITALSTATSNVSIRTLISGVVSGTCTATFSAENASSIVKTSSIQAGPSSSTCQGFDVSKDEFSPGQWAVTVSYKSGDIVKQTESKTFTI